MDKKDQFKNQITDAAVSFDEQQMKVIMEAFDNVVQPLNNLEQELQELKTAAAKKDERIIQLEASISQAIHNFENVRIMAESFKVRETLNTTISDLKLAEKY